jgi:hypothetical protein
MADRTPYEDFMAVKSMSCEYEFHTEGDAEEFAKTGRGYSVDGPAMIPPGSTILGRVGRKVFVRQPCLMPPDANYG